MNRFKQWATGILVALLVVSSGGSVFASVGDKGIDVSNYQSSNKVQSYSSDKFMFSQLGGYYGGYINDHSLSYDSQVSTANAQGVRAHTYIYSEFSGRAQADEMLNYYLPKITTPKGSIVALDVESGSPDTDSVLYALNRVKEAGYTPVIYGTVNFLSSHIDLTAITNQYPLWEASYPNCEVTTEPDYSIFNSWDNVALYQFTSTYEYGGMDASVDLTGITDNGYTKNTNPTVTAPQETSTASRGTYTDDDGTVITLEDGTFHMDRGLSVWYYAGHSYSGNNYYSGESVHYFGYVKVGQYVYVAYHANDGNVHYVACRDSGEPLGYFE